MTIESPSTNARLARIASRSAENPFRPLMREVGRAPDGQEAARQQISVALVRGPIVSTVRSVNNEAVPAIGLAYIAGYLVKKGYTVTIVDAVGAGLNKFWPLPDALGYQCQGLTFQETLDAIPAESQIVAFSVMFSGEWPAQRELIRQARERFPDALFVAGGEHITALPELSLRQCPALDLCVRGEGEHALFEIVEAWRAQGNCRAVNGVSYLDEDHYAETSNLTRIRDVDSIPWPTGPKPISNSSGQPESPTACKRSETCP